MNKTGILALLLLAASSSAFAVDNGAVVGSAVGAAAGAAIGNNSGGGNGAVLGAALGAAAGALLGSSNKQVQAVPVHAVSRPVAEEEVRYRERGHRAYRSEERRGRGGDRAED